MCPGLSWDPFRHAGGLVRFRGKLLGMMPIDRASTALAFRMDDRMQRLLVSDEPSDTLAFMGWEVAAADDLEIYAARLEQAGVAVHQGSRARYAPVIVADQALVEGFDAWAGCSALCQRDRGLQAGRDRTRAQYPTARDLPPTGNAGTGRLRRLFANLGACARDASCGLSRGWVWCDIRAASGYRTPLCRVFGTDRLALGSDSL